MTKAIKECDIVFDKEESEDISNILDDMIRFRAVKHFIENEGMTLKETDERVELGSVSIKYRFWEDEEDQLKHDIVEIRVEAAVKEKF